MKIVLLFLVCLVCLGLYSCDGARILVLGPFGTYSHKLMYMPIAESLADKGHNVTVVSPFAPKNKIANIREIPIEGSPVEDVDFFQMRKLPGLLSILPRSFLMGGVMSSIYDNLISNQEFQRLQKEEEFDVVLIDAIFNDFCLPIADLWKAPIVMVSASIGPSWILGNMGVAHHTASYPSTFTAYDTEMNFIQRFFNTLEVVLGETAMELLIVNRLNAKIKKDFPQARSIQEVAQNLSMCIVTSNPALNWPRPLPPSVIEVAGLHIKPPKPLPSELQKFADGSGKEGFILFTLGSIIKSSSIPVETVQSFVRAFSQIPQRVIWKWEADTLPLNLPPNVLTVKWLPQGDLLAHPNLRLFITHGGLLGLQEAIFNSVPLLALPVVNDQILNMVKIAKEGAGISLKWEEVTEQKVKTAIQSLLHDPSYRENMARLQSVLVDEPLPSREKAVYWIEHVLRYRGATHLRIASLDLPFYQHHLLDVIALMVVIFLITVSSFVFVLRRFCKRRVNNGNTKKTQ